MSASNPSKLSVPQVLSTISKPWNPKIIGCVNGSTEVRIAKLQGKFIWHAHPNTDELFYVVDGGPLMIGLREPMDGEVKERSVVLDKGDLFVVPKGMQHLPSAEKEAHVMMIEQSGTVNTGDQEASDLTVVVEDVRR